jgi:hypothetical protein
MQIQEARTRQSETGAVIGDGLDQLDLNQIVEFQEYSRVVLPKDGYIFWQPTVVIKVPGALHHTQSMIQNEDETFGLADVTFTTQDHVTRFDDIPVNTIYVATRGDFRYAFSRHQGFFQAAGFWHYQGQCIQPAMLSQLLDPDNPLDPNKAVASNSLPIWLAFNGYQTPLANGFSNPVTLYPSFAVPTNLPPPYGVVHIPPEGTQALQAFPRAVWWTNESNQQVRTMSQLMCDKVRITLYGLQNDAAVQFHCSLLEYIGTQGPMGIMNQPSLRDGKRTQVELQAIAMQKFMDVEVSYDQCASLQVARNLLLQASIQININAAA